MLYLRTDYPLNGMLPDKLKHTILVCSQTIPHFERTGSPDSSLLESVHTLHVRYDIQPFNNFTTTVNSDTPDISVNTACLWKLKSSILKF
jgi:hypothetical protein